MPNGERHIVVNGLEDDTYTLTEIATDKGYVLLKDGVEIIIAAAEGESACETCGAKLLTWPAVPSTANLRTWRTAMPSCP